MKKVTRLIVLYREILIYVDGRFVFFLFCFCFLIIFLFWSYHVHIIYLHFTFIVILAELNVITNTSFALFGCCSRSKCLIRGCSLSNCGRVGPQEYRNLRVSMIYLSYDRWKDQLHLRIGPHWVREFMTKTWVKKQF